MALAAGRVTIGFSNPYVALHSVAGKACVYSKARKLARGVDVKLSPTTDDGNDFYADNTVAESGSGILTGGTLSLTVDGLNPDAEEMIQGIPEKEGGDGGFEYGDDQQKPYVSVGYIREWKSNGEIGYTFYVVKKVKFAVIEDSASTRSGSANYQTQALSASIYRCADEKHTWKYVSKDFTTEDEALTAMKKLMGVTEEAV